MRRLLIVTLLMTALALPAAAGEFSPFLDLGGLPGQDLEAAAAKVETALQGAGLHVLGQAPYAGPDLVEDNPDKRDGRSGMLVLFEDAELSKALLAQSPRYYLAALQRVGIYHDADGGMRVTVLDAEMHLRVVANDLADDAAYEKLAAAGAAAKARLLGALRQDLSLGDETLALGPVRDTQRIREGKKDMFMMVGPLTYYRQDSQFPLLHEEPLGADPAAQLQALAAKLRSGLAAFAPTESDLNYRWSMGGAADLAWTELASLEAPGQAILIGLSRPRTEALCAQIVGLNRDSSEDRSPGLDHLCAMPIEILIHVDGDMVKVRTAKEMYRMDLFFWDAGKAAFMKYAQMPAMLDKSLKKATLGE
jgi:hypothetical protein